MTLISEQGGQMVLETERFRLRPLRDGDGALIAQFAGQKSVAQMTPHIPHPYPVAAAEAYVAAVRGGHTSEVVWALDGTAAGLGALIGLISLCPMDRNQSEIAYWIAPVAWNTGLASAAVLALVAANPLDNATLFASVFQDNPASSRVLIRAGFRYIGEAETPCLARATVVPTWTYLCPMSAPDPGAL